MGAPLIRQYVSETGQPQVRQTRGAAPFVDSLPRVAFKDVHVENYRFLHAKLQVAEGSICRLAGDSEAVKAKI